MLTILFFLGIFIGLIFPKSKAVRIFQYSLITVIFVFNTWNQDEAAYRRIYSGYYGMQHEPGFDLLCQICNKNGVAFETFRSVYIAIAIILLLFALNKMFKDTTNRAYSLILLYPLLPFVELLRNLMAIAIVTCGIAWYFSVKKEKIKHKIIYIIIILLAASFHYNVLFFLIILLPYEEWTQKYTFRIIITISISSIAICNIPFFARILGILFKSEKVLGWFDSTKRIGFGVILAFAFHIISFLIYHYIFKKYYKKYRLYEGMITGNNKFAEKVYSLNVYSFALMGLYTFNMEFFCRLYVFVLLMNCFHISSIIGNIRNRNIRIVGFLQLMYHTAMFVYFCQVFDETGIMSFVLGNNMLIP